MSFIVPMVQSVEPQILTDHLAPKGVYEQGIRDLSRVDVVDKGTFFMRGSRRWRRSVRDDTAAGWWPALEQSGSALP
jgi:hypothetical protein